MARPENLVGFVCEEQVHEIQEGRVRACGPATPHHRGLMTHGVTVAVSGQPAPHPGCGTPNQTAGFGCRIGWTVQLNRQGRVGHRWRLVEEQRNGQELGLQDLLLLNHLGMERMTTSARRREDHSTVADRGPKIPVAPGRARVGRVPGQRQRSTLSTVVRHLSSTRSRAAVCAPKGIRASATGSARASVRGCARPDRSSRRS